MPATHLDTYQIRLLTHTDIAAIERLVRTSEYIYQRFTLNELPLLLKHYPAVGMFNGSTMHSFLLAQSVNRPTAWIGGFGVSWTESSYYLDILFKLLDALSSHLVARGVKHLHYSGNDSERDWLRDVLLKRGFIPYRHLYSYDKYDYEIPAPGNQQVLVRPAKIKGRWGKASDMTALLAIEHACFEDLWRYDAAGFSDIAATHPYFAVAELHGQVVGYQFNALDSDYGYLVRIAVHPSAEGQHIGIRLMAEAIHFFQRERVTRIMLNSQADNTHAHRLYEWFGFVRIQQMGFVLRKHL
ncbi:MAG: GNAT family N-acetyltransferase [Ktedonobacteraceae bacterium]